MNISITGYKVNPAYTETKSKRLQLLIQPSLLDWIKTQAKAQDKSVNDYVHTIFEIERMKSSKGGKIWKE